MEFIDEPGFQQGEAKAPPAFAQHVGAARFLTQVFKDLHKILAAFPAVKAQDADAALAELPEPDETVDALLRAKLRGKAADRDTIRKAGAALVRRGFTWEAVKAATDRYLAEMEFEE